MTPESLIDQYRNTRARSETICRPLEVEDYVVQPTEEVSPPKWHLGHTTWFFEQFVLVKQQEDYRVFNPDYAFLFNSYYNNMGDRTPRYQRGFMTRPTVREVFDYRRHVDLAMDRLCKRPLEQEVIDLIAVGIHHEQQHQELLVYDIKYILGSQPTVPDYGASFEVPEETQKQQWINIDSGLYPIGAVNEGFAYDNERPRHHQFVEAFSINNRLVTQGEFLEFIEDGGYGDFNLWHDEAWHFIQEKQWQHPLYWHKKEGVWFHYTLEGLRPLNPGEPIAHLSFYEAHAFAEWSGMRLPTEFEWEIAADQFSWGLLWEWTNSAYLPYPGFEKAEGALGEYNGKFMLNQMVLRGASVATARGHARKTYRNFFHASSRWMFSGLRLVMK